MTSEAETPSRHDLEAKIVKRCWENEAFHKEFVSDPAAAFVKYLNVPAESVPEVVVHEEPPGSWHIVIPARPANTTELSDQDLEKLAGGVTPTVIGVTVAALTLAAVSGVASFATGQRNPDADFW